MLHEFNKVNVEIEDGVATISLNDPDALNSLSIDMLEGLDHAISTLENPANGVRCAILTGVGRGFCAGANLSDKKVPTRPDGIRDAGAVLDSHYHPLLSRIKGLKMPFLTAINGVAAGAGMSFALMGDMVIADEKAYFLQAFRRIGLIPDAGSTYILPRLIGMRRAMELSLMGDKLPAATALDWGLINKVVPAGEALAETKKLAVELASGPTVALGLIRQTYWDSLNNSYEEQLRVERVNQRVAGQSNDFAEGVIAFLQKRPAEFKGD